MDNSIIIINMRFYIINTHTIEVLKMQCQKLRCYLSDAVNLNAARPWDLLKSNHDAVVRFLFYQLMYRRKIFTAQLQVYTTICHSYEIGNVMINYSNNGCI